MTLIELMIVIAILGIIVAIGYPSYQEQVRKSRRAEGMGELLELADRMERHYSDVGTYDQADGSDMKADILYGIDTGDDTKPTTDGNYLLSIDAGTDNVSFTARAVPQGNQAEDKCKTFVYDSQGGKSVAGGATLTAEECHWK